MLESHRRPVYKVRAVSDAVQNPSTDLSMPAGDVAAARARLHQIIAEKSFSEGGEIRLASGRSSTFYFNMKPTMMDPEGAVLIARLILDALKDQPVDYIGGLEMGAVPIVSVVAPASFASTRPIPAFFVRKKTKEHGTRRRIEGLAPGASLEGKDVVIVEDVTTTGGSALEAVRLVREAGGRVRTVLTLVDRGEGAAEALAGEGLRLNALFHADEFRSRS